MTSPISDYALIGDCETAALVGRNGSIDWLCWPRFDSPACFAALLGNSANGRWLVAPRGRAHVKRRYRPHSLILETIFSTREGQVTLIDFLSVRGKNPRVIRIIRGDRGAVGMRMEMRLRFGYGRRSPAIKQRGQRVTAVSGSDRVVLLSSIPVKQERSDLAAVFTVRKGQRVTLHFPNTLSRHRHRKADMAFTSRKYCFDCYKQLDGTSLPASLLF